MALVIYSARTGRIRRIITDEVLSDVALRDKFPTGTGEGEEINVTNEGIAAIQAEITLRTGLTPQDDRYVLVTPSGDITGAIIADLDTGDSLPGVTLVEHPTATVGWRQMQDSTFQRSESLIQDAIDRANAEIAILNGAAWLADQQALGLNPGQINQLRQDLIDVIEAELATLLLELTDRQAAR